MRVHHPDSPQSRDLPPAVRRARFQSISHAYDVLRGKKPHSTVLDPVREELERRRRHEHLRRTAYHHDSFGYEFHSGFARRDFEASADDRWKDRVIICVGVLVCDRHQLVEIPISFARQCLGIGLAPAVMLGGQGKQTHLSAAANLAQARAEAREFGVERRQEIRRRVQEYREQSENGTNNGR